ncbi:hypothetical protein BXZ70DRAFT_1006389 [Cristinia sonorae]|uniref:tRNA (uracil-O(2)-)-methyltransferase n=1 Tax=Cristinia sonorae TaxID=1940300 RepID=A0A8K0XS10_9AGAR|nr:hypothetical protein BXZ70DRAFT_1006389 [Cristinia sonorae]
MLEQSIQRARFSPVPGGTSEVGPLRLAKLDSDAAWIPLIHCPANFPPELFAVATSQLVHHPEYNSTLILRSETVSETTSGFSDIVPTLSGFTINKHIHRRLLPRRPGRDTGLEQHCTLYSPTSPTPHDEINTETGPEESPSPSVLVLTPIVEQGSILPYYHPAVSHIAFRYIPIADPDVSGILQIEAIPLEGTPTDPNSRLYRTALALLDTLHRYGWGALTNYKKRVNHDCIVPREEYQDLYLVMRERHKHLVNTWKESTDPLKHVYEDIGIATFLMLLWKQMYSVFEPVTTDSQEPWHSWGRAPSGFLDLGCGNGLLTHILVSEGYLGHGIDVRKRVSWGHYPESTQASLHVEALDPTSISLSSSETTYLGSGVFIIGNHADELTPWVPVLSTLCDASGYLSIPCCPWTFDMKYERSRHPPYPVPTSFDEFVESLGLGGDGSNSSAYSRYRIWLASLHAHCGWVVESETLRIPSTRNWALVGRRRSHEGNGEEGKRKAEEIMEIVTSRGMFKTRTPEGKAGDH